MNQQARKSSRFFIILIVIVVLVVAAVAAGIWISSNKVTSNPKPTSTPTSAPASFPSQSPMQTSTQTTTQSPTQAPSTTVTFDFDSGSPALQARLTNTPFNQTVNDVTALFSSPSDLPSHPAFSVQSHNSLSPTSIILPLFSNNFLYPNTVNHDRLDIKFSRSLTSITLKFSTIEYNDPGVGGTGSTIRLTAYVDSPASSAITSTTTTGIEDAGSTYPEGTLSLSSVSQPFNLVEIDIPYPNQGAAGFMIDNITITST